jgi:hypothetical protein
VDTPVHSVGGTGVLLQAVCRSSSHSIERIRPSSDLFHAEELAAQRIGFFFHASIRRSAMGGDRGLFPSASRRPLFVLCDHPVEGDCAHEQVNTTQWIFINRNK